MNIEGIPTWLTVLLWLLLIPTVVLGWIVVHWAFNWYRPAVTRRSRESPSTTVKSTTVVAEKANLSENSRTFGRADLVKTRIKAKK